MSFVSRGFRGRRRDADADLARVPPGQSVTRDFPVLSAGATPQTPLDRWTFSIENGGVLRTWTWEKFRALPSEPVTADIHCVTRWSKLDTTWEGVLVDTLLDEVDHDAGFVDQTTPVTWPVANEPNAVRRFVRKLEREAPGPVRMCYEAGPGGDALQRQVTTPRVHCQVIAPALVPRKPGERVKTNRREARKLVELRRAGLLTEVRPPTLEEEAVRDLCRARDDAREGLQRCRHRLGKLFLRRGLHYHGRNWTRAHRHWIEHLAWTQPAERVVVHDYLLAIDQVEAQLHEFDARLTDIAQTEPYREPVGWLRCFRGIDT